MQGYDPDNGLKIEKRDQNKAFKDVWQRGILSGFILWFSSKLSA